MQNIMLTFEMPFLAKKSNFWQKTRYFRKIKPLFDVTLSSIMNYIKKHPFFAKPLQGGITVYFGLPLNAGLRFPFFSNTMLLCWVERETLFFSKAFWALYYFFQKKRNGITVYMPISLQFSRSQNSKINFTLFEIFFSLFYSRPSNIVLTKLKKRKLGIEANRK